MMTREEAIEELERLLRHWDLIDEGIYDLSEHDQDAVEIALSALRPVSRERVERIRGTWEPFGGKYLTRKKCSRCGWDGQEHIKFYSWCPNCGSPMTDEAVEMVLERLEALKDES